MSHFQHPNRPELHPVRSLGDAGSAAEPCCVDLSRECRPFGWPDVPDRATAKLWGYWDSLKRGAADIPFADDIKLGDIPQLADSVFLLQLFDNPRRFRFEIAGRDVSELYGGNLAGEFIDEISMRSPLDYLISQCHATVEARAPTVYRSPPTPQDRDGYSRALFPCWQDGRIGVLMGIVTNVDR